MSIYAEHWDRYVKEGFAKVKGDREDLAWPGDEWGVPEFWQLIFDTLFVRHGVGKWTHAVEIGSGSGKYTGMVLETAPKANVLAFDISDEFLKVCRERLQDHVESGRLSTHRIVGQRADEVLRVIEEAGLSRKLDAFYSIDAMVHVDLQYLIAYITAAALTLKPNGLLVMSLADATTDLGFETLMMDLRRFYALQGRTGGKFEFMSPDMVESVLARLGFKLVVLESLRHPAADKGRDIHVVARLDDLDSAQKWREHLEA